MSGNTYAIVGGSIWGNRGAEAMLVTTIGEIRKFDPDAIFNVYSIYPKKDKLLINDCKINIQDGSPIAFGIFYFLNALFYKFFKIIGADFLLFKKIKALKLSCCLLDIGGITFSDGRTLQLLYNVFSIWPAILLGVPVVKLSQAMGPFRTSLNRFLANCFLPKCEMIFARGYITHKHLLTLSLERDKIKQSADITFLYESEYSLSSENEDLVKEVIKKLKYVKNDKTKIISIIPSSLILKKIQKNCSSYTDTLLYLIETISQKNIHIIILPNASRFASAKAMNNDLIAINLLKKQAEAKLSNKVKQQTTWVNFDINTKSIRSIISLSDALITSRFHGMVAGLSLCTPTMVIGWSHKYHETLADFKISKYSLDYKSSGKTTIELFNEFWNNKENIRKYQINNLNNIKSSAKIQFTFLKNFRK